MALPPYGVLPDPSLLEVGLQVQ